MIPTYLSNIIEWPSWKYDHDQPPFPGVFHSLVLSMVRRWPELQASCATLSRK